MNLGSRKWILRDRARPALPRPAWRVLRSLEAPIPEEMPIIGAAVLSHEGVVRWWLALPVCVLGVLSGDMVLYWVGRHWGEQVLHWRLVRLVWSPAREQWLCAAYRRHALKTVVTVRHVMGLRAAPFLLAGSARVPFWEFVVADAGAAVFGVPVVFGLAYFFTDKVQAIMADVHRAERWLALAGLLALAAVLGIGAWRWHRRIVTERAGEGTYAAVLSGVVPARHIADFAPAGGAPELRDRPIELVGGAARLLIAADTLSEEVRPRAKEIAVAGQGAVPRSGVSPPTSKFIRRWGVHLGCPFPARRSYGIAH